MKFGISFEKLSVKKKINFFGYILGVAAVIVISLYLGTNQMMMRAQSQYEHAADMANLFERLRAEVDQMEIGMFGYLLNPSNQASREKTEKADEEYGVDLEKLKVMAGTDDSFQSILQEALDTDQKYLHPIEHAVEELAKTDSKAALAKFEAEALPHYDSLSVMFTDALTALKDEEEVAKATMEKISRWSSIVFLSVMGLGLVIGVIITRLLGQSLIRPLESVIGKLTQESDSTKETAVAVSSASAQLAQAATEQAASLQETAASVEEMSAMISKNADNAGKSVKAAVESNAVAAQGRAAVGEMISSIKDINDANTEIMKQIEESNARITEITKVIAEIGNKTKVINDIVFQTKLLSFNASVEAARAGEHGKGFAVVAEEVGNLAQMSGNAAKEIAQMLSQSIQKVEGIVSDTKSRVEGLIATAKDKVSTGTKVAEESGKVLDEIVTKVNDLNQMVSEIATASSEQATGVQEITKAMGQLDEVTHQNSSVSQTVANNAGKLSAQSESLAAVVKGLTEMVYGAKGATRQSTEAKPTAKREVKVKAKPETKAKLERKVAAETPVVPKAKAEPAPAPAPAPVKAEKVVPIAAARKPKEKSKDVPVAAVEVPLKKAVGGELIPSEDDPRFKDV